MSETQVEVARIRGKVKWFNVNKGYGFITPLPGQSISEDVFVHITAVKSSKLPLLNDGEACSFNIKDNKGRPNAINIKLGE